MRIAYDATPAAMQRAGVGRYARELLKALVQSSFDDQYLLPCAAPKDAVGQLLDELPPGAWRSARRLSVSDRILTIAWHRARVPISVERLIGPFDLYHATDFVAPPMQPPLVVTIHDLSFLRAPQFGHPPLVAYLRAAVPRSLRRASVVIAVSTAVALELADAYPWACHRVMSIPNGVSVPRHITRTSDGRPTVLIVGTIEPRKNHVALFDAMDEVRVQFPDARLVVAGRVGWRAEPIVSRLRELVARGDAEFIEAPNDERLDDLYALASVAAFPSHYEGFGLPVLEAMSRGVAVVAGDIPALRETGGDVAVYVDPSDSAALAASITHLLADTTDRSRRGEQGILRARSFTWDETARRTHRAYTIAHEGSAP